jgi:hypothetical protein
MRLDNSSLRELHDLDGIFPISDDHTNDRQRVCDLQEELVMLTVQHSARSSPPCVEEMRLRLAVWHAHTHQ